MFRNPMLMFTWAVVVVLVAVLATLLFNQPTPHDLATTPLVNKSNYLVLYVDPKTGCHYLGRTSGYLVPRMAKGGIQVGCKK